MATDAVKGGRIKLNGDIVKPSREVKLGEKITYRQGIIQKEIEVIGLLDKRVGAKLVEQFVKDLTPESEYEKARQQRDVVFARRDRGAGRPTKKERRDLEKWGEWE